MNNIINKYHKLKIVQKRFFFEDLAVKLKVLFFHAYFLTKW